MQQTAKTLLLIRPSRFGFNNQTASSNSFQQQGHSNNISSNALAEFDAFTKRLSEENIHILIFNDIPERETPDAVFPNNWISMHHDGTVVLYPMQAVNRRAERRPDIVENLTEQSGFYIKDILDLTSFEKQSVFLEGTGSMVFDHINRIVYVALSSRSHTAVIKKIEEHFRYKAVAFNTKDSSGQPVYHTNVLMSIGNRFAVVCPDLISEKNSRLEILETLDATGRTMLEISPSQVHSFAGNILEVQNNNGDPIILLSETALDAFSKNQIRTLENFGTLLPASIPTIEKHGGGSVRCMVAEVFLPDKKSVSQFKVRKPANEKELKEGFELRWKILRKPWNQPKGSETDEQESTSMHFLAFDERGHVVGTARLQQNNATTGQVRYMAVDKEFEGKGIGRLLLEEIEKQAQNFGMKTIFLQAREVALPFYLAMGYVVKEKTFLLFDDIQHYAMEKDL